MKSNMSGFSVVIPTYNRSKYLPELLQSLNIAADQYGGPCEVIIIDDSEEATATETERICHDYGAQFLRGPSSVRIKRNMGIERAAYPLILFVDSDVTVAADLLSQHAAALDTEGGNIVGSVGVTRFIGQDSWMWDTIVRTQFLNAFSFAERMPFPPWATCSNTAYRRSALIEVGLFDITFPFRLGGDDADLGIRLGKAGHRLVSSPGALVFHTRETWASFGAVWRRAFRWGRMDLHLFFLKHSDRVGIGLPKFFHVFLLLLIAGLVQLIVLHSPWPLLLPVIWAGITLVLQAISTVRIKRESWRYFFNELAADVLGLTFEGGAIFEGLKHGKFSVLYKGVQRGPVLPTFAQQEWIAQGWSMWIALAITLAIQLWWLN
jgi:GT2 family glycosyltransferase